jgi:hypothetical protein
MSTSNVDVMMIIIFWEMTPCGSYKNLVLIRFLKEPHGVISQKMIIIIDTAVETSNLTMWTYLKILSPGPVLHGTK